METILTLLIASPTIYMAHVFYKEKIWKSFKW